MKDNHIFIVLLLSLISSFPEALSFEGDGNTVSDSAFNAIIASYYNSSPFYSMIDPQELLKEFANKKIVRKKKLRPKKESQADKRAWVVNDLPSPSYLVKKVRKRLHLNQRETVRTTTTRTTSTTTSLPIKTLRMRNKPVFESKPSHPEFSERSYDTEIDYFDRNGLEEPYEDFGTPKLSSYVSNPGDEEELYAELKAFAPGRTLDPDSVKYNEQHPDRMNEERMKVKTQPKEKNPIFTPDYGHPYAEPISKINPIDSGIYEVDFLNPHTGHFDIPKIYDVSEYSQKTTEFAPTIPTTTTTTTTTEIEYTTTTPQPTTTTAPEKHGSQSVYVKSLQRRYPRVNDYDYKRLPKAEELSSPVELAHIKAEHRQAQGPSLRKHPGYRDLPPQRRPSLPRRRFQNTYKEQQASFHNNAQKENTQILQLTKEFFAPASGSFKNNPFKTSPYSGFKDATPPKSSGYRTLSHRYPTLKSKEPNPPPSRYNSYEPPPKPQFSPYPSPKPSIVPFRGSAPKFTPSQVFKAAQQSSFRSKEEPPLEDEHIVIDSQFKKFRDNSEFSGYLDNSDARGAVYDFDRGFPLLPPPPAMIATTQNFFGFTDVPKLGSKVNYNPPELIYNKLYEGAYAQNRQAQALEEETPSQMYDEREESMHGRDYFSQAQNTEALGRMYHQ